MFNKTGLIMLKKLFLSVILSVFLLTPSISSAKFYHQAIGGDPLALAFGTLTVTYEQQVAPKNSFTIFGSFWGYDDWTAGGIGASYRFYLLQQSTRALEGFSFGPFFQISYWSYDNPHYTYDGGTSFALGGEAAYKWVFGGGFEVEPNIHISFPITTITGLSYHGVWLGITLGYAW